MKMYIEGKLDHSVITTRQSEEQADWKAVMKLW